LTSDAGAAAEPAPAKINLYLHVLGRRSDGYHELDSLVAFAAVGDALHIEPADELDLAVTGPFAAQLAAEPGNLVLRAARALARAAGRVPTGRLVLNKRLPVASGLGGGSADAAAALRLLTRHWRLGEAGIAAAAAIAPALGADVPVCLASQTSRMSGIGEHLAPVGRLPPCGIVLVNPGFAVATADVFRTRTGAYSVAAQLTPGWTDIAALVAELRQTCNDLAAAAIALHPPVETVIAAIAATGGCLLARMSGSGATCFGLFRTAGQAEAAATALARPGWWVWGGSLRADGPDL